MNALLIQRRTVSLFRKETELGLLASMRSSTSTLPAANPLVSRFFSSQQRTEQYVNVNEAIAKRTQHRLPRLAFYALRITWRECAILNSMLVFG